MTTSLERMGQFVGEKHDGMIGLGAQQEWERGRKGVIEDIISMYSKQGLAETDDENEAESMIRMDE